jgi:uncharacterized MAPEG superfamily protein
MKTELYYLLLTAMLTGLLWIPVVIGKTKTLGPLTPERYKSESKAPLPDWVNRANRAHLNALENLPTFAVVVLVAQFANVSTPTTVWCAEIYFLARLAHVIVHIIGFGQFMLRTVLFTIGWIAFFVYAIVVLMRA